MAKKQPAHYTLDNWSEPVLAKGDHAITGVHIPARARATVAQRGITQDSFPRKPGSLFFTRPDRTAFELAGMQPFTCSCGETIFWTEAFLLEDGRAFIAVNCSTCEIYHVIETTWKKNEGAE